MIAAKRFKGIGPIPAANAVHHPIPIPNPVTTSIDPDFYMPPFRSAIVRLAAACRSLPNARRYLLTFDGGLIAAARRLGDKTLREQAEIVETLQARADLLCEQRAGLDIVASAVRDWEEEELSLLAMLDSAVQNPQGGLF